MLEMLLTRTLHGCLSTETGSWEGSNRETHPTLSFYPWAEWKWLTKAEALAECWFQFPCVWGGSFHSTEQSSATAARFPTTQLWHLEMMSDPTGAGLRPTRPLPSDANPKSRFSPCFGPICYRSKDPMIPSLGLINWLGGSQNSGKHFMVGLWMMQGVGSRTFPETQIWGCSSPSWASYLQLCPPPPRPENSTNCRRRWYSTRVFIERVHI